MKHYSSLSIITTAIILILVLFACFVGYKYIAINLEKEVEEPPKENPRQVQLDYCIEKATREKDLRINWSINNFKGQYGENWQQHTPISMAFAEIVKEAEQAEQQAKDNCYKQFK